MNTIFKIRFFSILIIPLLLTACEKEKRGGLPTDGDGNEYDTIVIGTQTWFKENLKTTKYNNGTPIPEVIDNDKWSTSTAHAYCWYNNDPEMKNIYGALYNWYAAKKNICPAGWLVPTLEDWNTLIEYLGGENMAGAKLKETGSTHWAYPNNGATNESGFTARPGGERNRYGEFNKIGYTSIWWTSSPGYDIYGWRLYINSGDSGIATTGFPKEVGFSVRCIKDH